MAYIQLSELVVYQKAMNLGNEIWRIASTWDSFSKNTIGRQIVRSADSIAANIAEGHGRFYYKEKKRFCYYSRGSRLETKTWLAKAYKRNLISVEQLNALTEELSSSHYLLNKYIKSFDNT